MRSGGGKRSSEEVMWSQGPGGIGKEGGRAVSFGKKHTMTLDERGAGSGSVPGAVAPCAQPSFPASPQWLRVPALPAGCASYPGGWEGKREGGLLLQKKKRYKPDPSA